MSIRSRGEINVYQGRMRNERISRQDEKGVSIRLEGEINAYQGTRDKSV